MVLNQTALQKFIVTFLVLNVIFSSCLLWTPASTENDTAYINQAAALEGHIKIQQPVIELVNYLIITKLVANYSINAKKMLVSSSKMQTFIRMSLMYVIYDSN